MKAGKPDRSTIAGRAARQPPEHRHDTAFAIGFLAVFTPVLAVLIWLFLGPLRGQREAWLAGLVLGALSILAGVFWRRAHGPFRSAKDVRAASRSSPLLQVVPLLGIFAVLVVIPIATGESQWAGLLGLFAAGAILFIAVGLRWLIWTR